MVPTRLALAATLAFCTIGTAQAGPSQATLLDASLYGPASASVSYDPNAPDSNFGQDAAHQPSNASKYVAYTIQVRSDGQYVYGLFTADPSQGGAAVASFANVYFDLDPQNGNGSDLGFELSTSNQDAFIPGVGGSVQTPEVATAASGNVFAFAIPVSDFTGPIAGLNYAAGQAFPDGNQPVITLRLSQSFGYSVAGGPSYGPNRLGAIDVINGSNNAQAVAVPEPASIAVALAGFAGLARLRRKRA